MYRKIVLFLFLFILLIPATAFASSTTFYTLGGGSAPYEPVDSAAHGMFERKDSLLIVDFIDQGNADCILLRCGGETMIVDGAAYNQFKYIEESLAAFNVRHFDYMINTHAHNDHIQGLIALIKHGYTVGVYMSCYEDGYTGSPEHTTVRELLAQRNIPYKRIGDKDHFKLGDADVTVFRDVPPGIDKNRHSIVLKVVYGSRSVILMADVGGETQNYLLDHYDTAAFKADVLKYPHHGIKAMSGAFLAAVSPAVTVITNNRRAVPGTEKQLAYLHIPRYYTHQGVVDMQTDGQVWHIEQIMPRRLSDGN